MHFIALSFILIMKYKRIELWEDLKLLHTLDPWMLCGDLNCVINVDERIGSQVRKSEMREVKECMTACAMEDVESIGHFFTRNNKQQGNVKVSSKLNRVMANQAWQNIFPSAGVCFQSEGEFDHSPAVLDIYPIDIEGKKPFKYYTMWRFSRHFETKMSGAWNSNIQGTKMYKVMRKLKRVKIALNELNKEGFSDIQTTELQAHQRMLNAQTLMHEHPGEEVYAEAEIEAVKEYHLKHTA